MTLSYIFDEKTDYLDRLSQCFNKVDYLICENCERELPNDKFFTKNGCIWCTTEKKK